MSKRVGCVCDSEKRRVCAHHAKARERAARELYEAVLQHWGADTAEESKAALPRMADALAAAREAWGWEE